MYSKHIGLGLLLGIAITATNYAFSGEISPIVIAMLLLAASVFFGRFSGRYGWIASGIVWVCLPLSHLFKYVFNLPDTLHPNTPTSILMLAEFTLMIVIVGTSSGIALRIMAARTSTKA